MRYKIIYDNSGRLRLRMGQGVFSSSQGYGIEKLLTAQKSITSAEANSINGSILIHYKTGYRAFVLAVIDDLGKNRLPKAKKQDSDWVRELDDAFYRSLAAAVCKHYVVKLFLPAPLRTVYTLRRILSHLRKGLRSLQDGKPGVDVLDAAAVTAADVQGDLTTASSIMMLLNISELLEDYTRKKACQTLTQSLAINIDGVWVVHGQQEVLTPISQIQVGTLVRVHTGSVIPLDGEVADGEAIVNEASMTGEPLGVLRKSGNSVYAGTAIEEGTLVVKVRTLADNTRIQNIVSLIDHTA